jgi:hypothetical protein
MIMKKIIIISSVIICILMMSFVSLALTPQQVIELKKAGVSDQTIQLMIKQEEAAKKSDTMGTREEKDEDGNTVTIYSTGKSNSNIAGDEEAKNVERAWEMLRNMNLKIYKRQ